MLVGPIPLPLEREHLELLGRMNLAKCGEQFQLGVGDGAEVLKGRMKGGREGGGKSWNKSHRGRGLGMG